MIKVEIPGVSKAPRLRSTLAATRLTHDHDVRLSHRYRYYESFLVRDAVVKEVEDRLCDDGMLSTRMI
jgi:hypothetical protein